MSTLSLDAPNEAKALRSCRDALRRIAGYTIDPELDKRMLELGERKEFLDSAEHAELMVLVSFAQKRTLEKLEAEVALKRLESVYPDLGSMP
jgi:hypothetical protein